MAHRRMIFHCSGKPVTPKWFNASDASVMVLTDSSREILAAIRGTKISLQKLAPEAWDHLTPADVIDLSGRFPPSSDHLQALSIFPSLPQTGVFQTPHGTVGLVQIIEANGATGNTSPTTLIEDHYPKTLKLRYKLVLDAKPADRLSTQPPATQSADVGEPYRQLYTQYKETILKAAQAGNADEVATLTAKFHETLGGKLLYLRVQRLTPGDKDKWEVLLDKYFSDRKPKLPAINDPDLGRPQVSFEDGFVLILPAKLGGGRYEDDVYITMAVEPARPPTQPATRPATQPSVSRPAQVSNVGEVVASLKAELVKISKNYPELTGVADRQLDIDAQGGSWSLLFFHNSKYLGKQGYEDTGPNPAAVIFRITTPATYRRQLASTEMQMPWRDVRNRRFIVADRVYVGKAPTTPGFEPAVRALLEQHVAMLDELERTMPAPAGPTDPNKEWVPGAKAFVDQLRAETYAQSVTMMADFWSNYLNSGNSGPTPMLPESTRAIVNGRRFAKLMDDTAGARWSSQRTWTLEFLNADIVHWARLYQDGQRPNDSNLLSKPGTNPDELIVPLMFRMNAVLLLIAQHPEPASLPSVVKYVHGLGEHASFAVAALAADRIVSVTDLSAWNAAQRKVLEQYQTWKKMPEANAFTTYATVEFPSYRELSRPQLRAGSTGVPSNSETPPDNISVITPQVYTVHIVLAPSGSRTYSDGNSGKTALAKAIVDFAQRVVLAGNP